MSVSMATKVREVDLISCPVCFEDFSEVAPHVPRILPCFHTLCEHCVEQLLQNRSLECPECREKHHAPGGVKTFQQNKYIIAYITKVVSPQERRQCPDHGEEMMMFCKRSECGKPICHLCLVKSHKFHNVVDLGEERKENYQRLMFDIEKVSMMLTESKSRNQACQEGLKNEYEKSLNMIKLRKEEVVRKISEHMDKIEAKISEHRTDQDTEIQKENETIETNIKMIQGIQDGVNETTTLEDIKIKSEMVQNLFEEAQKRSKNKTDYTFLEFCDDDQYHHPHPITYQPIANPPLVQLCGMTRKRVLQRSKKECCIS